MRPSRLLFAASLAALLLGCQTAPSGNINELPSNNPTATSTDLSEQG